MGISAFVQRRKTLASIRHQHAVVISAQSRNRDHIVSLTPVSNEKPTLDLATGLAKGTLQLVAANGDVINGSFVGRALPEDIPKGSHYIGLLTITSGTGRFQGATGGLTVDRLFDDTNLPVFSLGYSSFTGTINIPASTVN